MTKLAMDLETLAESLCLSARTIEEMVKSGSFPPPIQPGGQKRIWRTKTVEDWLAAREDVRAKSDRLERIKRHVRA